MKDAIIVRRYSEAFLRYAEKPLQKEAVLGCFKQVKDVFRKDPEMWDFFTAPQITFTEKSDFIDGFLCKDFPEEFRNFLKLLIERQRIDKFMEIAEYIRLKYVRAQKAEAVIKTSFPIELDQIQLIKEALERKFKRGFKLYIELDGSLLGGVQVVIGNTIIDGSVRKRLDELKEKLSITRIL
ncbi:MAG: ATP synthase F1 subunit delta [Candidatus Omnitrophota bacterium]